MHRELNPKLFSDVGQVETGKTATNDAGVEFPFSTYRSAPVPESFIEQPARTLPYAPVDIPAIESRVETLFSNQQQLARRDEVLAAKIEELAHSVNENLGELKQAITKLEERSRQAEKINETRALRLLAKIGDANTEESKIQEMIDRQNMVIRGFENRLLTMQTVISQQEAALHLSEAALSEARAEIARLKRI